MRLLRKFKCAVCGCESANFKDGGRYCQKCKLIYGPAECREIVVKKEKNPRLRMSRFFSQAVEALTISARQRISKQLGGFPRVYNEQSKLDAKRVNRAEKDAKKHVISKTRQTDSLSDFKICACCGERFKSYGNVDSKHCAVCWNVFGTESLKSIDKLSDRHKCELYKIRRAGTNDEVKSITPQGLHQNLLPKLNIRLRPTSIVLTILMRAKTYAQALENEKHRKHPFMCSKCGDTYLLEEEHPEPFICDRCKNYDEEHMKGTKLRNLPGLPSMTYEHLALLPEYAACMFTKHMTDKELEKLKAVRAKVKPPSNRTFTEYVESL